MFSFKNFQSPAVLSSRELCSHHRRCTD